MAQKVCKRCGISKNISEFGKHSKSKDGVRSICKNCNTTQALQYYYAHKNERSEYSKKYNLEHATNAKIRKHNYYQANKDYLNSLHKEYRNTHNEYREKRNIRANEYSKLWAKSPIGNLLSRISSSKRREQNKVVPNSLLSRDVKDLIEFQENRCAKCQKEFSTSLPYTLDHIIPLSMGGGLTRNNVQLLCRSCNSKKGAKTIMYRKLLPDELVTTIGGF